MRSRLETEKTTSKRKEAKKTIYIKNCLPKKSVGGERLTGKERSQKTLKHWQPKRKGCETAKICHEKNQKSRRKTCESVKGKAKTVVVNRKEEKSMLKEVNTHTHTHRQQKRRMCATKGHTYTCGQSRGRGNSCTRGKGQCVFTHNLRFLFGSKRTKARKITAKWFPSPVVGSLSFVLPGEHTRIRMGGERGRVERKQNDDRVCKVHKSPTMWKASEQIRKVNKKRVNGNVRGNLNGCRGRARVDKRSIQRTSIGYRLKIARARRKNTHMHTMCIAHTHEEKPSKDERKTISHWLWGKIMMPMFSSYTQISFPKIYSGRTQSIREIEFG